MCSDLTRGFCLSLLLAATPVSAQAGKIYGLVIGVDEYQFISDLNGAVNDARDIEDALTGLGADVTTLIDGAASRAAILGEWRRLAVNLQPDDQLIVTYAGHGSNEPEAIEGSEQDGRDETLLLAGFSPYGTAAGERIRDDEIAELLSLSRPGQVIFVADACHSGTLSRNLAPSLGYRYVSVDGITNDPLPPPPPRTAEAASRERTALFLAAADDSEKTPEFLINGQPRGALSYSFAASLRDASADENADNKLTKGEIETYVRRKVRAVSQGSQRPQVSPAGQNDTLLFATKRQLDRTEDPVADIVKLPFEALPRVAFYPDGSTMDAVDGITSVANPEQAALRLDAETGAVHSMVGDKLLQTQSGNEIADIQAVVDKLRFVEAMAPFSGPLNIRFDSGDRTYLQNEVLRIEAHSRKTRHIALLNIASNGEISFLYPIPSLGDPKTVSAQDTLRIPVEVEGPFGADHVLAIETGTPTPELLNLMRSFDGTRDLPAFWNSFRHFVSTQDTLPTVAVFPFHTASGQEG